MKGLGFWGLFVDKNRDLGYTMLGTDPDMM